LKEAFLSENNKTNGDANSREFSRGVEAGLNSENTKYWQAGYELGQEYSDKENQRPIEKIIPAEPDSPLFLMDTLDGHAGAGQDEKDESAE
jgi:hypothetical protein